MNLPSNDLHQRGILSFMHVISYVLSLTKTGVNITDDLVVFQSNDHLYKGSRLAFKHCLPARSKLAATKLQSGKISVLLRDTLGMQLTDTLGF